MPRLDLNARFGFLVNEVGRLYGRAFDQLARAELGLSRAQCRVLVVLAAQGDGASLSQAALAESLDLTAMGVATLCSRMAAAGWLTRQPSASDRRAYEVALTPAARQALQQALALGDRLQARALAGLAAAERRQLLALLGRVRGNLAPEHA